MKSLPWLFVMLVACGPAAGNEAYEPGTNNDPKSEKAKPPAAGDVQIELDKVSINGLVFEPVALNRPGMPLVEPKRKTTIEAQRTVVKNSKGAVLKQAQSLVLATLLYQEAKTNKAQEKQLWTEARQVLRDAVTSAGKEVDELPLRLLGSYELLLEDYPAAEKAWSDLVTLDPKSKEASFNRAWWAYSLLRQNKNAEALAAVKVEPVSDKQPELAYVTAWAKWRTGDDAGAWQAITTAAKGWPDAVGKLEVDTEVLLFASRARLPFAQVLPELYAVAKATQPAQQYDIVAKLGLKGYQFAGRWSEGVAALEEALKVIGTQVQPIDRAVLRYTQADYTVRLNTPDVAAKFAKQAIEAVNQCPKCTAKDKQDVVLAVSIMARMFHIFYATANDIKYYQPANDLYVLTIPLIADPARRTSVNNDAETLQRTLKNTKAGTGIHSRDAVNVLLGRHNQEIQACYERGLLTNPKLGGSLTVTLESDQSGVIQGVATEPKAGQADLAAVAGCAAERAKTWTLPKRGTAGTTRIRASFALAPKAASAGAPAASK